MHLRDHCRRGVPLRGLSGHPRPCRAKSFLLPRPAALLGSVLYPAQVCSRGWVERAFLRPRAHVSLRRPASNPIYFVRAHRSPALESELQRAVGRGLSIWRGAGLLGFDSHLRSASSSLWPKDRSCLGLCLLQGLRAHIRARDRARPRIASSTSGSTRLAFMRTARPNPLMRFRRCFAGPFSVLMGPMPGLTWQLRGPLKANHPV